MKIAHVRLSDLSQDSDKTIGAVEQGLEEHLRNVETYAGEYAAKFGLRTCGELAGLLHDVGKASEVFQQYIRDAAYRDITAVKKIDHATAGARILYERFNLPVDVEYSSVEEKKKIAMQILLVEILANVIIGHHSGLYSFESVIPKHELERRLTKDLEEIHYEEAAAYLDSRISRQELEKKVEKAVLEFSKWFSGIKKFRYLSLSFITKALFSCLIDADRLDSFLFEENKTISEIEEYHDVNMLWNKARGELDDHLLQMKAQSSGVLNQYRNAIGDTAAKAGREVPTGIYRMTVPTGGGKTLSVMRFALEHALAQDKVKIFYITNYISVIEQNADVIRRAIPSLQNYILEFHSNVEKEEGKNTGNDLEEESTYSWKEKSNRLLQERWEKPVIFTSMVQFLNTFFIKKSSARRRIHSLSNSIVIFDEVQSLPSKTVDLFCQSVNFLEKIGTTSVLCTATQPDFHILHEGLDMGEGDGRELIPNVQEYFLKFKRQNVHYLPKVMNNTEEIEDFLEEKMKNTASLLMICNTVKSAYQIYRVMEEKKEYDCYYLSTALCPAHRQAKLKDIKEAIRESRTGNGANKILCITTPIIEAGVDISFETVVRSISGLDSIAQAGGRGNRNKERETGEMFLIKLSSDLEKTDKLPEIKLKQEITEEILLEIAHSGEDILSPEVMKRYFKKLHTKLRSQYKFPFENEKADISGTIFDILHENKNTRITKSKTIKDYHPYFQNRSDIRQADREFFVIKENGVGILVPYKGNAVDGVEIIAGLQSGGSLYEKYKLLQKAQQITITLFDYQRKELMEVGGLYEITDIPGLYVLNEQFYSENAGYQGIDNKGPQTFLHS